jgi:hypothetical protein
MATTITTDAAHDEANWAVDRATGLPEVWGLVAAHLGLVGAWRLMRVCKAARVGAREFLSTLPGLVVCGGYSGGGGGERDDVWRLDMATLRWEPMPGLVTPRSHHACCAVRGKLVDLGGNTPGGGVTSSVEMVSSTEEGAFFVDLPPTRLRRTVCCVQSNELKGLILMVANLEKRVVVGGDEVLESARGGLGRAEVRGDVEALRPAGEDGSVRNGRHEVRPTERGQHRSDVKRVGKCTRDLPVFGDAYYTRTELLHTVR